MNGNIVLTGMPNSGKSTIGLLLSNSLNMSFVDTDQVIRDKEKRNLADIVIEEGQEKFLEIQEKYIIDLHLNGFVISTGGSVVLSETTMEHLKKNAQVVFLKISQEQAENRMKKERRLARNENQSFEEMFNERQPLYEKYADIVIECGIKQKEEITSEIMGLLK